MKITQDFKIFLEDLLKKNRKEVGIYFFNNDLRNFLAFDIKNPKNYFLSKPFKGTLNLIYAYLKEEGLIRYYFFMDNFITLKENELIQMYKDNEIEISYTELEFNGDIFYDIFLNTKNIFLNNPFYKEKRKVIVWSFK